VESELLSSETSKSLPLNFSVKSFSAFARFDGGSELTRLFRFSDSMVVVVGDGGEDETSKTDSCKRLA
jgi:hypothetical protein